MTQQLSQESIALLEPNARPMVTAFSKIVSWLKKGSNSEHALPPAVADFLADYNATKELATQLKVQADDMQKQIDVLKEVNTKLNKSLAERETVFAELTKRVVALESTEKPKATKKAKATETAEVEQQPQGQQPQVTTDDPVELTAKAIDAGEVSTQGLEQLNDMIDKELNSLQQPNFNQPIIDDL